jgi:hypothetical protein
MSLSSLVNDLATRVGQEIKAVRAELSAGLSSKANDSAVVHNTGAENISGVKAFLSGLTVPNPSASAHPVRHDDSRLSNARTPTAHTHAQSDVTGLVTALDGKSPYEAGPYICTNYVTLNGRTTGRWCNGTISIPDPGFPYMLRFESGIEMRQNSNGRGRSQIYAGGSGSVSNQHSGGTLVAITPFHDRIGAYEQLRHFTIQTTPLTGAQTLYICGVRESGTGSHDFSNFQYQVHAYCVPVD